jgi:hypothetical protein
VCMVPAGIDRVVFFISCGACEACISGQSTLAGVDGGSCTSKASFLIFLLRRGRAAARAQSPNLLLPEPAYPRATLPADVLCGLNQTTPVASRTIAKCYDYIFSSPPIKLIT